MSEPSPKLARDPDQLSPPLGELDAAIREYLRADQLGEDAPRRVDLALPVRELCLTCRPKHHEHEMSCTDGTTANVVWTYSTIIVGVKDRDGRMVGGWTKGRLHPDMPGELDRELDRVLIELARVGYERAWGERTNDERGRPLPVPATDRLLAIADRIEAQQAGGRSEPTQSADSTSVDWFGTRYEFNKTQAECIKLLWAEWDKGCLTLSEKTIGEEIGSSSDRYRLVHTFRSRDGTPHPAWGTMIESAGKGIFRLSAPNHQ